MPHKMVLLFRLWTDYWIETIPLNLKATLRWTEYGRYAEQSAEIEMILIDRLTNEVLAAFQQIGGTRTSASGDSV